MDNLNSHFDLESEETSRHGLGIQRWTLLIVAFILGVVSVYTVNKAANVLEMGPSSAVAAPAAKVQNK